LCAEKSGNPARDIVFSEKDNDALLLAEPSHEMVRMVSARAATMVACLDHSLRGTLFFIPERVRGRAWPTLDRWPGMKKANRIQPFSYRQTKAQGCQIFLVTKYQNGKNIPNYHKAYLMSIKYNKNTVKWTKCPLDILTSCIARRSKIYPNCYFLV
jgi:hypothetical protein